MSSCFAGLSSLASASSAGGLVSTIIGGMVRTIIGGMVGFVHNSILHGLVGLIEHAIDHVISIGPAGFLGFLG